LVERQEPGRAVAVAAAAVTMVVVVVVLVVVVAVRPIRMLHFVLMLRIREVVTVPLMGRW
jgi:hypothetical protein